MGTIAGPKGPISYERDAQGYPRIHARDALEGAWARGWFHAVDRLVQVQLALIVAHGRALEFLGESPTFRFLDRIVRMFDLTSDAQAQVSAVRAETREVLETYCRGFEAGVAKRGWPLVLRALRVPRAPYTPAKMVVLQRLYWYFGLTQMQHGAEGLLAELAVFGAKLADLELLAGENMRDADIDRIAGLTWPAQAAMIGTTRTGGSNAIAISKARSNTGGALLLAEPHLEVGHHPPTAYASHTDLATGGYYQGIGLAGLPFLGFGRTQSVGWAYTYAHGDNVDYLVERCRKGTYLAAGEWRPLRKRVETVKVRGRRSLEQWTFWDNDYGAIAGDASAEGELPCVRWSGLRETAGEIDAWQTATTATSVAELSSAMRGFRSLSLHGVFADAQGDIGYLQLGQIDERPEGWRDPLPWPAWDLADRTPKPLAETARPAFVNPPEGAIVSANEARQGPNDERWCMFPEPRYRHDRLTELVAATEMHDLSSIARASYDPVDACARRLMPIWAPLLPADAKPLAAWAAVQPSSRDQLAQMGAFHALHEEVVRELLSRRLGAPAATRMLDELAAMTLYQFHLDDALALERPSVLDQAQLTEVLLAAWPRARLRIAQQRTPTPIRIKFTNALTQGKLPFLGLDTGPVTFPGGPTTPFQSRSVDLVGQRVTFGPGCHYLTDMSKPGGWYNLPGGASERRFGPGYGTGVDAWARGEFLPIGDVAGSPPAIR